MVAAVTGVLGGTFDPMHYGHLRLLEEAQERLSLAQMRVIPAGVPPHRATPQTSPQHRLAMARLALAGRSDVYLDSAEVDSAAPSYTVHTLERLRRELEAEQPLVFIVGADAFQGLAQWHRWQDILSLAHIAVATRPGYDLFAHGQPLVADPVLAQELSRRWCSQVTELVDAPAGRITGFAITPLAISATLIRDLLRQKRSARYLLPDSVLEYAAAQGLYSSND